MPLARVADSSSTPSLTMQMAGGVSLSLHVEPLPLDLADGQDTDE
jgi:hypothetical protein